MFLDAKHTSEIFLSLASKFTPVGLTDAQLRDLGQVPGDSTVGRRSPDKNISSLLRKKTNTESRPETPKIGGGKPLGFD